MVKYHGLARRRLLPPVLLMRPLLNGGTLARRVTPDLTNYRLAFDLLSVGYRQWSFPAFGLIFVVVGLGQVLYVTRWRRSTKRSQRVLAWTFLGFASLWTMIAGFGTYLEYARLARAVRNGDVAYVEGPVEDFVPMPFGGHRNETFRVGDKTFAYSDYTVMAGFNNTASHGGPIRAHRRVRIGYVDGAIVRLEVAP